ncbi:IclR family transcriptional regulator C-terminal domain-containing protein [Crenobacter sp. SG2305]|uniref:IclR family transcriptional regulator domain-containing protein n=1 Tax=Crenobacter oryzisoli TaxID=3056844 RepID=UPI0025AB3FC5|nr:IclR family transcriptional regulator C-terminal domain-containing protein [Crenobacter sp. SG2305]MDN0081699.1 IclR family transcriptional regulator C-terminal domain-containing protein [Crenobacter sp. SG2305]
MAEALQNADDSATESQGSTADDIASQSGDPNFMTSLARGLAVIQAFSQQRRLMSISQISQKTGIPRAAVRRCLYTLAKLGFVAAEDGRNFALRPRILSLGHAYLASTPLAKAAQPVLRHVSNALNESSSIAILDGDEILYIARASTSRIMTIDLDIGSRLPASSTSMGRVLLSGLPAEEMSAYLDRVKLVQYTPNTLITREKLAAELAKVKSQGYSVIDQELEIGLRSIAVPILSQSGKVVAAINVGVQAARVSVAEMETRVLPVLREAAEELSLLVA